MSEPPKFNPYKVLGVKINAAQRTIKSAYRYLSKKYHPDHNPGDPDIATKFQEIQEAYDAIGTPEARAHWDATGEVKSKNADEELPSFVEGIIIPTMHQILQNFHNYKSTDLVGLIRKEIRNGLSNARVNLSDTEKLHTRLMETAKRIRRKGGDDNILAKIVETQAHERERNIDRIKAAILDMEACVTWLEDYSYVTDFLGAQVVMAFGEWASSGGPSFGYRKISPPPKPPGE